MTNTAPREEHCVGAPRILHMDDEPIMRDVVRNIFESLGFQVISCGDGSEAVQRLKEDFEAGESYALVLLDLTVPNGMGGVETAREIRTVDPAVPLFISSGQTEDPVIRNPRAFCFTGSICKPFNKQVILQLLEKHFSRSVRPSHQFPRLP